MSATDEGPDRPRPDKPRYGEGDRVTTVVYDGKGVSIPGGDLLDRANRAEPRCKVDYDRSRHTIRITGPDGKTAEFDDQPQRFLVLSRNPGTRALEPVIVRGEPLYYYLAREK